MERDNHTVAGAPFKTGLEESRWNPVNIALRERQARESRAVTIKDPNVVRRPGTLTLGEKDIIVGQPTTTGSEGAVSAAKDENITLFTDDEFEFLSTDRQQRSTQEGPRNGPPKAPVEDNGPLIPSLIESIESPQVANAHPHAISPFIDLFDVIEEFLNLQAPMKPTESSNDQAPIQPTKSSNLQAPIQPIESSNLQAPIQPTESSNDQAPIQPTESSSDQAPIQPTESSNDQAPIKPTKKEPKAFSLKKEIEDMARYNEALQNKKSKAGQGGGVVMVAGGKDNAANGGGAQEGNTSDGGVKVSVSQVKLHTSHLY